MHKQRLAILITAGLGAFATFMPWAEDSIMGTIYGTNGDGWINLMLFAAPLVISLLGDKTKSIKGGRLLYGAIIPSIIAGILGFVVINHFKSETYLTILYGTGSTVEFGLYLVVLAGIGLPILAVFLKDKESISE